MFGQVLKQARMKAGLTQEDLAHAAQLDRSYVSMLENDHKSPTLDTLLRLAKSLKVRAWQLVKAAEESSGNRG